MAILSLTIIINIIFYIKYSVSLASFRYIKQLQDDDFFSILKINWPGQVEM